MLKSITNFYKNERLDNSILLINLVLAFFPISFVLGNLILNINILLFCILGIFHLKTKILTTKLNFPLKIIFLFFILIFFSTILSFIMSKYFGYYNKSNLEQLIKSILFFRYFIMLLVIYILSKYNILNFKYFFISAAIVTFIISFDIIFQYIFGFNIVGLKSYVHHNTSFFGDELISGGFVQNFSFFSILFLALNFDHKKKLQFILTAIAISFLAISIMLSGNRMPLILFLFGLFLLFLFNNSFRKIIPVGLILFLVLFQLTISFDQKIRQNYKSMFSNIKGTFISNFNFYKTDITMKEFLKDLLKKEDKKESIATDKAKEEVRQYEIKFLNDYTWHNRLLLTALDTWKENKIFGNGIKSFRVDCYKLGGDEYNLAEEFIKSKKNRLCSNHPHNYYFEILTETGVVGLFVTSIIAILFLVFIIKNLKLFKINNMENFLLLAATISLFLEVFPFKSTGSVFSTNNTTYIILIGSIILSYKKEQNKN